MTFTEIVEIYSASKFGSLNNCLKSTKSSILFLTVFVESLKILKKLILLEFSLRKFK